MTDGRPSGSPNRPGGGSRPPGSSRRRRRGGRGRSGQARSGQPAASPSSRSRAGQGAARTRNQASKSSAGRSRQSGTTRRRPNEARRSPPTAAASTIGPAAAAPASAPLVEHREVRANRRRAGVIALLGALGPALVVGVALGLALSILAGAVGGAVVFVVVALAVPRLATRIALSVVGARSPGAGELPRVQNLVDGLCPTFGLRRPALMVVDDDVPNACSVGSGPDHAVLVVTLGVERSLDLIEMEGVVAHELAHLKRGDVVVSAAAVAVLAPFIWLSGSDWLLHRVIGFGRELLADQVAVRAVRYPPGLGAALEKLETGAAPPSGSLFAGRRLAMSRWLWIDPSVGRRDEDPMGDLDLTVVRIGALAEN